MNISKPYIIIFTFLLCTITHAKGRSVKNNLNSFLKQYHNATIYLALASPYVNNPVSMFGHNFLLISKDTDNILDGFTLSFEAKNTSKNKLEYFYKGLTGGFKGFYYIKPTFNTLRLYNNFEDRNIFLFPLKLTEQEKKDVLTNIYIYSTSKTFPYYFIDQNCAYYLLDILETTNKDHDYIYFSPQDTVNKTSPRIDFENVTILTSVKNQIKHSTSKDPKLINAYKKARFELYKTYRSGEVQNYRNSLLNLNKVSLNSKTKVKEFKEVYNELILRKYSKATIDIDKNKKNKLSLSLIDSKYYSKDSISNATFLNFSFNNYKDNEYNFTLFNIYSKPSYESYFKDISWKAEARYLNSEYLYKYTTDLILGAGISLPLVNNLIFTVRPSLLTSKYRNGFKIQLITEIDIEYFYKSFNFISTYSKKYFNDSITLSIEYNLSKSIAINASYEKIKYYRETTLAGLAIRF